MAYDNRRPGDANIAAWMEAAHRGRWTFDAALDAIHAHYAENTDPLMPGHITTRIRAALPDNINETPHRPATHSPDPTPARATARAALVALRLVPPRPPRPV